MTNKKRIPLEPGLFTLPSSPSEEPRLIGSKCEKCGVVSFPPKAACPKCSSRGTKQILLSTRGKIHSSTVVRLGPPLYEGPVPYAIGEVKLPEGVIVPVVFTDCTVDKPLPIDSEAELVIERFGQDDDGNEVMTYKFRPVHRQGKVK